MNNPRKITTVRVETIGDGLGIYDWQQGKTFVLNATTSLVWQYCDGQTTARQLAGRLQSAFNVSQQQAEELLALALDELERTALLQRRDSHPFTLSRRQVITRLTAAGLSLILMPIVAPVTPALADTIGNHDDDDHRRHHPTTTTRPTTTSRPTTTPSPTTKPTTSTTTTSAPTTTAAVTS